MKFPIGFVDKQETGKIEKELMNQMGSMPVKSLVQVFFPKRSQTLTYYNDQFDLKQGDFVFVEGKLEGSLGIVRNVCKNFKIKVSDYKKVISVADTSIHGQLYMAGSHFICFDSAVLPYKKIRTWYLPPANEEEYVTGSDDSVFSLDKLSEMNVSQEIWERAQNYYTSNRVRYLCVDTGHGRAIVEGENIYEVEFDFADGDIRNLTCTCPCGYTCKHEVATMMQLRETLENISQHYGDLHHDYFATITKSEFFYYIVENQSTGCFTL
ncbi:MAG: hypothetical protein J6K84_02245 [Oscillospiraceae bacterium]|nr:hypothetical protein [Oscillospiraceae bacterium]